MKATPAPNIPETQQGGEVLRPPRRGQAEAREGRTGLRPLTLEGSQAPHTGQLEVRDQRGLPELQVGLPGEEMRSRCKAGAFSLSPYWVPAAHPEAGAAHHGPGNVGAKAAACRPRWLAGAPQMLTGRATSRPKQARCAGSPDAGEGLAPGAPNACGDPCSPVDVCGLHVAQTAGLRAGQQEQVGLGQGRGG